MVQVEHGIPYINDLGARPCWYAGGVILAMPMRASGTSSWTLFTRGDGERQEENKRIIVIKSTGNIDFFILNSFVNFKH